MLRSGLHYGDLNVRLDRSDDANSWQLTELIASLVYGFTARNIEPIRGTLGVVHATRCDSTPPHVVYDADVLDNHLLQWSCV